MRIASVTVDLLKVPLVQPYMAAGNRISEYWHVLARVTTDDGVEGFGYVVLLNAALVKPLADATRELSQLLKGMHVFEPEASWAKLVRAANWVGPGGFVNCAIAPLDIAMWDLKAKAVDVAREGVAIAKIAISHDHEFPLRIGLVSEAANRAPSQGKPIMGDH